MSHACDNPACSYYDIEMSNDRRWFSIFDKERRFEVVINRHLYKSSTGDKIFLCDVCHSAVEMLTKGEHK